MNQPKENGAVFGPDAAASRLVQAFVISGASEKSDTVMEMQKTISSLETRMEYMGTKADLQELRADFNKSMREFQEQCATRFDQMHDQLHNILLTLWVAIAGAFLTAIGLILSIIFGFPWEKLFALLDWIENGV